MEAQVTPALRTESLSKNFGGLAAVSGVSLALPRGARHALIGPNGAGKTTLINLLTGVLEPSAGEVYLGHERITPLAQHRRVKRGLARTFQINTLFPGLTVLESVALAVLERKGLATRWMRTVAQHREEIDEAMALLATLNLDSTVLFIEHDMGLVFRFAHRITVLVGGRVLTDGTPEEIVRDPHVKAVYLGTESHG